jgi:hypothetical protein
MFRPNSKLELWGGWVDGWAPLSPLLGAGGGGGDMVEGVGAGLGTQPGSGRGLALE